MAVEWDVHLIRTTVLYPNLEGKDEGMGGGGGDHTRQRT